MAQLKDLGEIVSDVAIMAKILESLPRQYNALQTAWDSVPVESQSLENLLERLIKKEKRLGRDDDVNSALTAEFWREQKEKRDHKCEQK